MVKHFLSIRLSFKTYFAVKPLFDDNFWNTFQVLTKFVKYLSKTNPMNRFSYICFGLYFEWNLIEIN